MDVDNAVESDEDTESQIKDLEQLTAVLEEDEPSSSVISRFSASTLSLPCTLSKIEEYSRIETAIALNKLTDDKLQRLEKILVDRLSECRKKLVEIQNSDKQTHKTDRVPTFRYVTCGKPYFKDAQGFQPPDNPDTILMAKTGMYDFSLITSVPGWTVKDKSEFLALIHKMSKDIKVKQIESQIAQLQRDARMKNIDTEAEILNLKKEIQNVSKKSLKELALPLGHNYDWDAIANAFNHRHTAQEYSSIWRLFLHPSINKQSWTKEEHLNLQKISQNFNLQDWEEIASQLNTGRTEYQCFVYFRTNMGNTFTSQKWSKEEEEYLKRVIEYYREDHYIPWGRVAASMENRTKIQVYNKYLRLIELRKGRFLPEEDAVILNCVEEYGPVFTKIKDFVAGRSATQLRNRYHLLKKQTLSTVWTVAEDKKLIQLMANQDSTTNFATISKYLPGKDRIHIRARYMTLMKWMHRHPNVDIALAPRRGARRLGHGRATVDLKKAVEKLKDRMQSEVEIKKKTRITRDSTEEEIDEFITAFFVTESIKDSEQTDCNDEFLENGVLTGSSDYSINLQRVLILLKARLNQNAFKESSYFNTYPEMMKPEKEVSVLKVKSYSRKSVLNTIKMNKPPDVWGNNILQTSEYVLPPNLATITGCRSLIAHVSSTNCSRVDTSKRRTTDTFRKETRRLQDRFNLLFVWPMLLSNEIPTLNESKNKSFVVIKKPQISILNMKESRNIHKALVFEDSDDDLDSKKLENTCDE